MNQIKTDLKDFQSSDWLILLGVCSLFLPHTLTVIVFVGIVLIALFKFNLMQSIKKQKGNIFIYGFVFLEMLVSFFYRNWTGLLVSLSFLLLFVYIAFYKEHHNEKLLAYMIECSLICSFLLCFYALYQFNQISIANGYHFTDFHIFNSPKRRIVATFQNANIYALMLEFMLALCLYRFLQTKKILLKAWYVFLALFQFSIILLTGCRAALVPLIFVIPIMLFFTKEMKLFALYLVCIVLLLSVVFTHPNLIPRFNDFSTIESRLKIWKTAIKGIQAHPLFGNGPWTYNYIYENYNGHKAVFCHNIYLEMISSFGIIGTIPLLGIIGVYFKEVFACKKTNALLFSLMLSCIVIVAIHGLVDGTLYPIKTNLFLLMILSSYKISNK